MRQRRLGWGAVLVLWLGLFGSGCALNVSLESDPDPGIVGQPVNYSVEVMNVLLVSLGVIGRYALHRRPT